MKKMKHRAGWLQRSTGRAHCLDNDKRYSLCGAIKIRPKELKKLRNMAFSPNACKRCIRMILGK